MFRERSTNVATQLAFSSLVGVLFVPSCLVYMFETLGDPRSMVDDVAVVSRIDRSIHDGDNRQLYTGGSHVRR